MKKQFVVEFQRGYEIKKGIWLNGGMCYGSSSYFDTLEEAIQCKNKILEKENYKGGKTIVNGIGISIEYDDADAINELKLVNIRIRARKITEWEEI